MDKEYVMTLLDGCGFYSKSDIKVLQDRCLLTIDPHDQKIRMHGLIREMGRAIVCEASPSDPGHRSRIWSYQDVIDVLRDNTGKEEVEGLSLDVPILEEVVVRTEAFAKMSNLRLLRIDSVRLSGSFENISKKLRWLHWRRCPLKVLPPDLQLHNLVALDMKFSSLKRVWKDTKLLDKLEILDLSNSIYLAETPNFSSCGTLKRLQFGGCTSLTKVHQSIGNLERLVFLNFAGCSNLKELPDNMCNLTSLGVLNLGGCTKLLESPNFSRCKSLTRLQLEGCTSLTKVHQSIGNVERLELLNLAECRNLRELPDSICNLTSLATLNLSGCSKLSSLPEHLGKLKALRDLLAAGSAITELPTSVGLLKNLKCLSLASLEEPLPSRSWLSFFSSLFSPIKSAASSSLLLPSTFSHLTSLRQLNLRGRNLCDSEIAIDFRSFQFLRGLNLGGNNFCNLPVGISDHPTLTDLKLSDCKSLQSIEELPQNLETLEAEQCTSIERYPNLAAMPHRLSKIYITSCRRTIDIQGWDFSPISRTRGPAGYWAISGYRSDDPPKELLFYSKWKYFEGCFPARKVPDWLDYNQVGSAVLFCMPSTPTGQFRAMIVCVIMHPVNEEHCEDQERTFVSLILSIKNKTKGTETFDRSYQYWPFFEGKICHDHAWVTYLTPDIFITDMNADEGDEIEVSIKPGGGILVKECGIHLPIHEYWH